MVDLGLVLSTDSFKIMVALRTGRRGGGGGGGGGGGEEGGGWE